MNFLRPNTEHTNNVYEKGRFSLIWNLSLIVCVIFGVLSLMYLVTDIIVFGLFFTMFSASVFSLFYLRIVKKTKPIFWLYSILASGLLIGSIHSLHYLLHYQDILWMVCIIGFSFIGLGSRYAIIIAIAHTLSFVVFTFTSLNTNIELIQPQSVYQLLALSTESALAFMVIIFLMLQYLKYVKYTRSELKKTKMKYKSVIDSMNEALIQDDLNGKIIFWNNKFLEMFGYNETDLANMNITDFIREEYHDIIKSRHEKRIHGESIEDKLIYGGIQKDGTEIWIEVNVSPVIENDQIIGTQSLIRDVTHRVEQEKQLQKINSELIKIEETERERIAYELHDGLNQLLVAARLHAEISSSEARLIEIIDSAISESRSISQNLVPKDLNEFGLISALKLLAKRVGQTTKMKIHVNNNHESDEIHLSEFVQFNIYRIIQECLNNTVKHANASEVIIDFNTTKRNLNITVTNNGESIPEVKLNNQNFLIAIRRRVNILNGKYNLSENKKGKVTLLFVIPLEEQIESVKQAV